MNSSSSPLAETVEEYAGLKILALQIKVLTRFDIEYLKRQVLGLRVLGDETKDMY